MAVRWSSTARWAGESPDCTGCATPRPTRWNPSERYASLTCHADLGDPGCPGHRDVVADPLAGMQIARRARRRNSVILRAMQSASGKTESHVLALIAVGSCAVADVACCR
ncbi:Ms4533A family Cys-rich leader peptide [Mycolicibacterium neworleansense]|uniref:Ms4533A family Cys-rich leader peptide n=1 Tax=Mycolicibacterium neworleansense TaxID=146018 RepID=UPI003908AE1B